MLPLKRKIFEYPCELTEWVNDNKVQVKSICSYSQKQNIRFVLFYLEGE